ncbi:MAG: PAS domain-containing protein [Sphingobacteriaceae bacterium]
MPHQDQYIFQNNERLELVLKGINAGVYELNLVHNSLWCSSKCFELLGFKRNEIESTSASLISRTLPQYRQKLTDAVKNISANQHSFKVEIELLHRNGESKWYEVTGLGKWEADEPKYIVGTLIDIDDTVKSRLENQKNEFLLEEAGLMAKVGGWELNLKNPFVVWSKEVCLIHEVPVGYRPSLDEAINFYSPSYVPLIQKVVQNALQIGQPFDEELKIITATKKEIWVRSIGQAIYHNGEIIGIRGVFQDIDEQKEKEITLQASLNLINQQNQRLVNFAHIVSHNLTSHATNLALTLNLLELETNPEEIDHFKENLKKISKSLNQTMSHLNDIVVIQTETNSIKKKIKFEEVYSRVLATLKTELEQTQAHINSNFDDCPAIEYIPAYLESILLNLISNAIKYRDPDKSLKISIKSYLHEERVILEVSDNGLGIDLDKYGNRLFGMYKTFHKNPNARGIGLFITKNQIEALGGKINVESDVKKGSTFKIAF